MKLSGTQLLEEVKRVAPSVAFRLEWEHDEDAVWPKDCGDPRWDLEAYHATVSASVIVDGELVKDEDHLSGCWDDGNHDPDINGYLRQMMHQAVLDLAATLSARLTQTPGRVKSDIAAAIAFLYPPNEA